MKKLWLYFASFPVFFLCSLTVCAQGGFTTVTGTVKDPNGITWACGTISAQLVTAGGAAPTLNGGGFTTQTSPVQLGCPTIPGSGASGSFVMRLADSGVISPSNTTWRFTVGTTGTPPPLGTGPQSFTYTTAINCSTNTPTTCTSNQLDISTPINALAPAIGAGGGVSPNSPSPVNVFNAKNYGAVGNTQEVVTVSTIAQGTGGCPASTPSGFCIDIAASANAPVKQSDIGLIFYMNEFGNGLNRIAPTTILGVFAGTGAHAGEQMITYSGSGLCGGTCSFTWGTDDTASIFAAKAASIGGCSNGDQSNYYNPPCGRLVFPCGGYMIGGGGTAFPGISTGVLGTSYIGSGTDCTKFFLRPDYNKGTAGNTVGIFLGLPSSGSAFTRIADFSITCSNFLYNFPNNQILSTAGSASVERIRISGCGNSSGNGLAYLAHTGITTGLTVADSSTSNNASALCQFNGANQDVYFLVCSNGDSTNCSNLIVSNVAGGTSSNRITFHGGFIDEGGASAGNANTCIQNSKDVSFVGTTLTSGAVNGSYSISVDATSEARCNSCTLAPFGSNGGGNVTVASGGVFRTTMSKFIANQNVSANWNCALTTSCIDDGGNNYSVTNSATFLKAGSAMPYSSLTHTWNTCYVTGTFGAITLCNQFLDQNLNLIHIKASSGVTTACTVAPVVTLTDGTNSSTLTITTGAATWDSGVISQTFVSGGTITVSVTAGTCTTPPTNFSVTYNAQTFNSL